MKILIVGFEPGRLASSHHIKMITETFRELGLSTLKKGEEKGVQVITYIVDGSLNAMTYILAKSQIEVLKPDAVLFITDKSEEEGEYMVARLASRKEEEFFLAKDGTKTKRQTLPFRMKVEIEKVLEREGTWSNNPTLRLSEVPKKYDYLHRLRCYCEGRIAWINLPQADNNSKTISTNIAVVLGGFHGVVTYVQDWEKNSRVKAQIVRKTSTDVEMIKKTMDGNLAAFNVKKGITEFIPRPYQYEDFGSLFRERMSSKLEEEAAAAKEAELVEKEAQLAKERKLAKETKLAKEEKTKEVKGSVGLAEERRLSVESILIEETKMALMEEEILFREATLAEIEKLTVEASTATEKRLLEECLTLLQEEDLEGGGGNDRKRSDNGEDYTDDDTIISEYEDDSDDYDYETGSYFSDSEDDEVYLSDDKEMDHESGRRRLSFDFEGLEGRIRALLRALQHRKRERFNIRRKLSADFGPLQDRIEKLRKKVGKTPSLKRQLSVEFSPLHNKINELKRPNRKKPIKKKLSVEFDDVQERIRRFQGEYMC